jgi:hypothetical protein
MSEISVESIAQDLSELAKKVEGYNKRLSEVDNSTRGNAEIIEELRPAMEDTSHALQTLNMAMQNLFFTQVQDQVLIEAVVRYMAGYKPGDFTTEMEAVQKRIEAGEESEGFTVEPKNDFDATKFYDLAKEVGTVFATIRQKRVEKVQAEMAAKQKMDIRKPKIEIVQSLPMGG